ncbi:hypothetical protein BTN49_2355 [Candidatus Enterovibrio escicola]|uniref:Uncharacterized protein n=1 Tax=Candidatus Enterovibrio escicola TaxID=1927127 RepID=A0A2A5T191_9GAMM|nr:hypothetical protein BTN49_2355 [Candidatus Enterovibrio escacola]
MQGIVFFKRSDCDLGYIQHLQPFIWCKIGKTEHSSLFMLDE